MKALFRKKPKKQTKKQSKGKGKLTKNKTRTRSKLIPKTSYMSPSRSAMFSFLRGTSLKYAPHNKGSSKKKRRL